MTAVTVAVTSCDAIESGCGIPYNQDTTIVPQFAFHFDSMAWTSSQGPLPVFNT